jgi:hypothetical protein
MIRRSILLSTVGLLAAPALASAGSLMPVRSRVAGPGWFYRMQTVDEAGNLIARPGPRPSFALIDARDSRTFRPVVPRFFMPIGPGRTEDVLRLINATGWTPGTPPGNLAGPPMPSPLSIFQVPA